MLQDHFKIAFKGLKSKKLRSWLTLLGIFIGIAAVVSLIGLGDGLRLAITSQFGISSTEVLSVQAGGLSSAGPPGSAVVNPLMQEDVDAIKRLGTVETAFGRVIAQGKLEFNDRVVFGMAMSIPEGSDRSLVYQVMDVNTISGRLLKDGDSNKVVLGYNFYNDGVGLGEPVRAGDTVLIQDKKFEVVGITEKAGSFIFDNIVHMQESELRDLFDNPDRVDVIAVKVKGKEMIEPAKLDVEKLLRKIRGVKEGQEDFVVETPQSILQNINSVLVGVQVFIIIIASISIIVGTLGIVNTMLTAVLERRSQIGIMKAIGAKNSDIFFLFIFESGILGLLGGAAGVLIGTIISYVGTLGINSFVGAAAPPKINFLLIFFALLGSFVIGSIAGIVPAMRAARQNPVDAIRG